MNLNLETIDIWVAEFSTSPSDFFSSLHHLLHETDVLVIGSYDLDPAAADWFTQHETPPRNSHIPYDDFFHVNRDEYPHGRSWHFSPTLDILSALSRLAASLPRSANGSISIDHIVAYREGSPLLPLLNFRHAFTTGDLTLSGHYHEDTIHSFSACSNLSFNLVSNPVLNS
ncbi:MAG: hypothetical protein EOP85_08820 [Verrucomicrobiaceae bacterium]|nr:MAG: hypothetical protein EOP85_08820 [Verrucomicrobiaceae bacterium]